MSWNPDALDQAIEAKMGTEAPVIDATKVADPPPVVIPPVDTKPDTVIPPVEEKPVEKPALQTEEEKIDTAVPPVEEEKQPDAPVEEVVDDLTAYKTAVDSLGGMEELEVVSRIAAPFLAADLNVQAVIDMLESDRGDEVANAFAEGMLDSYAASYASLLMENPDRIVTDPITTPEGQFQMAIRNDIIAFKAFRANGGAATLSSPKVDAPPVDVSLDTSGFTPINTDEYHLPPELEEKIKVANALASKAAGLDARVKALETRSETDTERQTREAAEAANRVKSERYDAFVVKISQPADTLLDKAKFSTNPDPGLAEKEDLETRRDIGVLVFNDLKGNREQVQIDSKGTMMTCGQAWDKALALELKGDILGARRLTAALAIKGQELTQKHLRKAESRLRADVDASKTVVTNKRTEVSGPGSGASPVLPIPPDKAKPTKSWENIEAQLDARMAARQPSAPVG